MPVSSDYSLSISRRLECCLCLQVLQLWHISYVFRYLQVIMGNVDVSILDKNAKYEYKEQYESFKLIINLIGKVLN